MLNRNSELKQDKDNKLKAKEYLYGQSIAAEICNFGEVDRCIIKKRNKQHHIQIPNKEVGIE